MYYRFAYGYTIDYCEGFPPSEPPLISGRGNPKDGEWFKLNPPPSPKKKDSGRSRSTPIRHR